MFAEAGLTLSCSFSEQPVLSFSAGALRAMWQAETCRFQDGHRGWGPWHQFRFARSSSKPFSPFCSRCHVIVCVHRPCQVTFSRRAMTSPESSTPIRRLLRDRWSTARVMSLKLQLLRVRCVGISLCLCFSHFFVAAGGFHQFFSHLAETTDTLVDLGGLDAQSSPHPPPLQTCPYIADPAVSAIPMLPPPPKRAAGSLSSQSSSPSHPSTDKTSTVLSLLDDELLSLGRVSGSFFLFVLFFG